MSRSKSHPRAQMLSDSELIRLAERSVDKLLDPENSPFRKAVMNALQRPDRANQFFSALSGLMDGVLPKESNIMLPHLRPDSKEWNVKFYAALRKTDRGAMVKLIIDSLRKKPLPREAVAALANIGTKPMLRKVFLGAAEAVKGKPGREKKTPEDCSVLVSRADSIRPTLERLLTEMERTTKRSAREVLEYLRPENEEACGYLLDRLDLLESAMTEKKIVLGKKIRTRAGLLADALPGTDHGMRFSTSIERIREERRRKGQKAPSQISPQN